MEIAVTGLVIEPGGPLRGRVQVPGDKSISHRALILGALGRGRTVVENCNRGDDVGATAVALSSLGASCGRPGANPVVQVDGLGPQALRPADGPLDAGNSGTTLRLLLGVCAGIPGENVLTGDASLRRRPMLRVVEPLRAMGARIDGRDGGRLAPLTVRGGRLSGRAHVSPVPSAQVKSALLLAGLLAEGETSITEPAQSRDHTERMLAAAGVELAVDGLTVRVTGGQLPSARRWRVPGDLSSALYLIVAACLVPGSDLTVDEVGLNPTRMAALDVLAAMGADLDVRASGEDGGEPFGSVRARSSRLRAASIGGAKIAGLIDEIPVLAVAAAAAEGTTVVTDAGELAVKESNRIATTAAGLRALGVEVDERPDGLAVSGPARLRGGEVDAAGDHRIALALAVAGLAGTEPVRITGFEAAAVSFPGFLETLRDLQSGTRRT